MISQVLNINTPGFDRLLRKCMRKQSKANTRELFQQLLENAPLAEFLCAFLDEQSLIRFLQVNKKSISLLDSARIEVRVLKFRIKKMSQIREPKLTPMYLYSALLNSQSYSAVHNSKLRAVPTKMDLESANSIGLWNSLIKKAKALESSLNSNNTLKPKDQQSSGPNEANIRKIEELRSITKSNTNKIQQQKAANQRPPNKFLETYKPYETVFLSKSSSTNYSSTNDSISSSSNRDLEEEYFNIVLTGRIPKPQPKRKEEIKVVEVKMIERGEVENLKKGVDWLMRQAKIMMFRNPN